MITIIDIKDETNTKTYIKGTGLYKSEYVLQLDYEDYIEDGYEQRKVQAVVQGSGVNQYQVHVILDEEYHTIIESSCTCKAFASYTGICKHCVAALLMYLDVRNQNKKRKAMEALENHSGIRKGTSMIAPSSFYGWKEENKFKHKTTTTELKKLLDIQVVEHTLPYMQNEYLGKVNVIPYLENKENSFQLEFKIGIGHMYVLKDLVGFLKAFETRESFRYGQKLNFIHHIDMFSEQSKNLVLFVLKQLEELRRKQPYHFGSYAKANMRYLYLGGVELEEFFQTLDNGEFRANIDYRGEQVWKIEEKDIERELIIEGEPLGLTLRSPHLAVGYRCKEFYFYFQEGIVYQISIKKLKPIESFLTCIGAQKNRSLFVEKLDIPLFVRELLPTLKNFYQIEARNFEEESYAITPATFSIYLDAPDMNYITCEVKAIYGNQTYNVYEKEIDEEVRDLAKEVMVGQVAASFCSAYDEKKKCMVIIDDEELIYNLLTEGIVRLQEIGEVYISDVLKGMKVKVASNISVGVSLSGDLLELELTAGDMVLDQLIEVLYKYDRKKKYYRLKNGDFLNIQGENIEALLELQSGLQIAANQWQNGSVVLPKYRAIYLDAQLKEKHGLPYQKNKDFKALIRNMKTIEDNDFEIPISMEQVLREYQKQGFLWIKTLQSNGFGGILADDMGLGKTLQVIAFLLSEYLDGKVEENKRGLIITPASLVFNWKLEIKHFASVLPVKMVVGTMEERKQMIQSSTTRDILITSYDLLKRDLEIYQDISFANQIIDEAQYIKNHNTRAAKAVKAIDAKFKLALTGTPMENRLSELWSIFDYLMSGFLQSYQKFKEKIEIPIVQNQEEKALHRLQKMIRPFVLRRLKRDVLTDLPDKLEKELFAKLEGEQQKLYDAHVKRIQLMLDKKTEKEFRESKIQILAELTKLRQICCNPSLLFENYKGESAKIEMCMELLQTAVSSGHKILLFSQFTTMLEQIQERMIGENITFYTLTGATKKEKRAQLVEKFNQDDTSVFCISLKAGGTGLNLTSADIVIHFDPWWNVAVQNQATDRAHRIGQKNVVTVYKLIARGTIEENIIKLQEKKIKLAEQVLGGEMITENSFTREDFMFLFHDSEDM